MDDGVKGWDSSKDNGLGNRGWGSGLGVGR